MGSPGTVQGRDRASPSKSSNLLEININGLRRLSRTSYDCYHIPDDLPRKATSGEDFDEDPLRHALHDRPGPKPGGGPCGLEGRRRSPGAFQEVPRAGRRAACQRGAARCDPRRPPSRWPTLSPPPRTAWSCSIVWGRSPLASAPRAVRPAACGAVFRRPSGTTSRG